MNLDSPRRAKAARDPKAALRLQVREAVRAAILDAAEELIANRGLHGAALLQIARKAGVAVGTLYNYFADRDALVRALFESRRVAMRPGLRAAASAGAELAFEPRLRKFVGDVLAVIEQHRRFFKVAIETEHLKVQPSSTSEEIRAAIAQIVAAGVAEGSVAKAQAEMLQLAIVGGLRALVLQRIADGGELVGAGDALVDLFVRGLGGASRK
ncbi:MAG TPA: TetR/AcrR family transcriptional regulator [Kofleriaceae bacterium]|nr:TetR/AcrR family transcriptional regulator [Kofleriaceae bacterium]